MSMEVVNNTSEFYHYELNGKQIAFHKTSIIKIQIGWGRQGYKTKNAFGPSEFARAVITYNGINIGNGYKKRLYCETLNEPVLARAVSYKPGITKNPRNK